MTRRELMRVVGRVAATVAGQQFFASWLSAAHEHASHAPPEPDVWSKYAPTFFSAEEFRALDAFTAILIPTDETPGAREAHVAPFIDFLLAHAGEYAPEMQTEWRDVSRWLADGKFPQQTESEQLAFVFAAAEPANANFAQFQRIKELTLYAFYTSRAGMIDNLEYKGLAYLAEYPGCTHPEHRSI